MAMDYEPTIRTHILDRIAFDNKDELVQLLTGQRNRVIEYFEENELDILCFFLTSCLQNNAVNCAQALLEGEMIGLTLDLNDPLSIPLHTAAGALSPKIVKMFLDSGARTNVRSSLVETPLGGFLPLEFAVSSIRRRVLWSQERSVFRLIVNLTGEGMSEAMETVNLLSKGLSDSEVSEVIYRYAAQGEVIELASLLLVLSEGTFRVDNCYIPSNGASSGDRMTLRQYVVNQIVNLEAEVSKLVISDHTKLDKSRKMKKSMMTALLLLEIFTRTRNKIALWVKLSHRLYPATPQAIANLFEKYGFKLTGQDTVYLWKPFGRLHGIKPRYSVLYSPEVKHYFPSGLPPLGSLETTADLRWDETDSEHQKLLSAHAELEKLSSNVIMYQWTPGESIFKLIFMLCLPKMKERLEALRLFAQNSEKINEIACCYAKEGKLLELAIILMFSWEKVMEPMVIQISCDNSRRFLTFQQFIKSELAQAVDLEYRLVGRTTQEEKALNRLCKKRKLVMISALHLLEIFERAGAVLQDYVFSGKNVQNEQVVKDISELLAGAGFKFKTQSIKIRDVVPSTKNIATERLDEDTQVPMDNTEASARIGSQRKSLTGLSYVLPCGFTETQAPYGKPDEMRKFLFTRYPRECYFMSSSAKSFRALWTSRASFSSTAKPLGFQERGVLCWVLKFPISRLLTTAASVLKRGIKYA